MKTGQQDGVPPSFSDLWGLPILFGCMSGLLVVFITVGKLVDRFGAIQGSLAVIAVGFFVSLVSILLSRLIGRLIFA